MCKILEKNENDSIPEEYLGFETYGTGDLIPFLPENISDSDELIDCYIKTIIPIKADYFEVTISFNSNEEITYQVEKGSVLKMNVQILKDCPGVTLQKVNVTIADINKEKITLEIIR